MGITYLKKGEQLSFARIYDFPFQALALEKQEIIREGFPRYFRSQVFHLQLFFHNLETTFFPSSDSPRYHSKSSNSSIVRSAVSSLIGLLER